MLDYAVKLTRTPGAMAAQDVDALRRAGFDDRGVLDVCHVASYYAYVNRLADGMGVELEAGWDDDAMVVSREEFDAWTSLDRRGGDSGAGQAPEAAGPSAST